MTPPNTLSKPKPRAKGPKKQPVKKGKHAKRKPKPGSKKPAPVREASEERSFGGVMRAPSKKNKPRTATGVAAAGKKFRGDRPTKDGAPRKERPASRPGKPGARTERPGARKDKPSFRKGKPGERTERPKKGNAAAFGDSSRKKTWRKEGISKPRPSAKRRRPETVAAEYSRPKSAPQFTKSTPAPKGEAFAALDGIHPKTVAALTGMGMTTAFPIQSAVIPPAMGGSDMLVQSPTGSGKTLAFGIPIVEQLRVGTSSPEALVLAPTRELAIQVCEDLTQLARGKNMTVAAVYGGAPPHEQSRRASRAAIVVATPGRLADLMRTRRIDVSKVRILILDEADRMLDMGFQPQVDEIVEKLPGRRQTMLFSATLEGAVGSIAAAYTSDPEVVRNSRAVGAENPIEHVLYSTTNGTKIDTVLDALDTPERDLTVIFVRTQHGADRLCKRLREFGHSATAIHGGMNQGQRLREYKRFQNGACTVLVATDVFARGMDLDRITHVINFDMPEDADTYQHRAGRTGRAGRRGTAITLVPSNQKRRMAFMVRDAGLPADLTSRMVQPSGKRWERVAEEERFSTDSSAASVDSSTGELRGEVASYDDVKGFGFITPTQGSCDVFFHRSTLDRGVNTTLARGATVTFELDNSTDRARASSVQVVRGNDRHRGPRRGSGPAPRTSGSKPFNRGKKRNASRKHSTPAS